MNGRRRERGNISLLMLAVVVVAGLCAVAVARVGAAATTRARADTAADAAALAAADTLALGGSPAQAVRAARDVAARNGAVVQWCRCRGAQAEVAVRLGDASGRARAVVGPDP